MKRSFIYVFCALLILQCERKEDELSTVPIITTSSVNSITKTSAKSGGTITDNGGTQIIQRGVCWATTQEPSIADSKTNDGIGTGIFTSNITGLSVNTTYYVRSYATNRLGTNYGDEKSFTTKNIVSYVNDFFIDEHWGWPDGIVALSNNLVIYVMENHDIYGEGVIKAKRGDKLDITDYFSGPGTPFSNSPDGITIVSDGRCIVADGQASTIFIIPANGGTPEILVGETISYKNSAIAPIGFNGTNVDPGDVIIPVWDPPSIIAINPDTKVKKTLVESSYFTSFCLNGVGGAEFGSDNYLYILWNDNWGNKKQPRIYRFNAEGEGEIFYQFTNWGYPEINFYNFDISLYNDWLYYFYQPKQPSEYSGLGTIFRMSLDGTINELVIDLNWGCQNLELSPDESRLFVGGAGIIKEIVFNE